MIDYLKFLLYFSVVPVTPTVMLLIEYLRYLTTIYEFNEPFFYFMYISIYVMSCIFWGTCVYKRNEIELFIKKVFVRQ